MAAKHKQRILVIDDDSLVSESVSQVLLSADYDVARAHNMEVALMNFTKVDYDAVVLDVFMPGMGGIEGIVELHALDADVPIIAISGGYMNMTPEAALDAAKKIGAVAVLIKPFPPDELLVALSDVLGSDVLDSEGDGTA